MRKRLLFPLVMLLCTVFTTPSMAQGNSGEKIPDVAREHILKNKQKLKLADEDVQDLVVSKQYTSRKSGVSHIYVLQRFKGIEIHGSLTNFNVSKEGKVLSMGNRLEGDLGKRVKTAKSAMSSSEAVQSAARYLGLSPGALKVQKPETGVNKSVVYDRAGISLEPITARLVYQPLKDGSLQLAWEVSIYEISGENWWNLRIDAATGEVLDKDNLVAHCEFDKTTVGGSVVDHSKHRHIVTPREQVVIPATSAGATYNVFPWPVESPNHGPRSLVSGSVADADASPLGWHNDGSNTYTITRGNNVYAYEDPDNTGYAQGDIYGYSPDGGSSLTFDFPIDFTQQPVTYNDAAITNLFYWNNVIHDMWYQYGFDETSGNFQTSNNGNGGLAEDHVMAEAQDSRNIVTTRNNANFATPPDGTRPRMQMYLWSGPPDPDMFRISSPSDIAGSYTTFQAVFSQPLTSTPVTGRLVPMDVGVAFSEGCNNPPSNAANLAGNIALVYRGTCNFAVKVQNAQLAGAIAVVVINNAAGDPIVMGGVPSFPITIPAVMVSNVTGAAIRSRIDNGIDVIVALKDDGAGPEKDGDFDNVIIAHEYGHGISNRLTGGPNVVNCLQNAEQAGEGWSDWFGLMMTMKPGDVGTTGRGIGSYPSNQPVTGLGIRPARYSTSFSVNPATYGLTNNPGITQPHGVGFVFATMLWDMTWALVDRYGFDPDLYHGNGGNNMAMQLVIDGLKLQPCRPGFVDSRDAILLADRINYGGANQELIWRVFARRGLGYSAAQGSTASRFDQVEAFDLPPAYLCQESLTITPVRTTNQFITAAPSTVFLGYAPSVRLVASGDSTDTYEWTPATGLSSTNAANPVFTATAPGEYTFTVKRINYASCTKYESITITVIDVRCGKKGEKVLVCKNGIAECISKAAVQGSLAEGATLGTCTSPAPVAVADNSTIVSNYPNPFSSSTKVIFTSGSEGFASLKVFDFIGGREIATLYEGNVEKGVEYSADFARPNGTGGMYIYKLITSDGIKTGTMVVQD